MSESYGSLIGEQSITDNIQQDTRLPITSGFTYRGLHDPVSCNHMKASKSSSSKPIPLDIQWLILDHFSFGSFQNFKICVLISQACYEHYSKKLYNKIYIPRYESSKQIQSIVDHYLHNNGITQNTRIKSKSKLQSNRISNNRNLRNDQPYIRYKERRLKLFQSCEYLKINDKQSIQSTRRALTDFQLDIDENPLKNVKYLILKGDPEEYQKVKPIKMNKINSTSNSNSNKWKKFSLWQLIKPKHICISPKSYWFLKKPAHALNIDMYKEYDFVLRYIRKEIESISFHNYNNKAFNANEIPLQRFFFSSIQ
ncbi:uncharacterized protein L201_004611 [Kwoniella dendrophila CBS 6074]|uniref:F-box domain-containing protein n=1 Tax=Kwoniella dendrophila CBS 6074 TaxID=1295534 RepID=A0AAX4JWC0_9TREE